MRRNSNFTATGAEKLILANFLIRDVECYKAYGNQQSSDLIAVSKNSKKIARIEVKSRVNYPKQAQKITSSNIKHKSLPYPDFYVSVFIKSYFKGVKVPLNHVTVDILVLPKKLVHSKKHTHIRKNGKYFYPNKLTAKEISKYSNNFELIIDFLNK